MAAKKTRKTQVPTARLVITICAVALAFGALFLTKTSIKILKTQVRMYSYYTEIQEANNQHDYFYEMALMYPQGGYMRSAEEWDEKADTLTNERANFYVNATDPVVKWACRDQFDWLTVLAGVAEFLVSAALWLLDGYIALALVNATIVQKRRQASRRATANASRSYRRCSNRAVASYRTR